MHGQPVIKRSLRDSVNAIIEYEHHGGVRFPAGEEDYSLQPFRQHLGP